MDLLREITRLSRGIERDGEAAREMWENNWMVSEDIYVKEHKPFEIADLVVDGSKY
jgi:uridine kinase